MQLDDLSDEDRTWVRGHVKVIREHGAEIAKLYKGKSAKAKSGSG